MNQEIPVDYAFVSPEHVATCAKATPFIDAPLVFPDHDRTNTVIAPDALEPIHNMAELKGLKIRHEVH